MTRVVRFHQIGEPDVLQIEDIEIPPPGADEVQIKVKALGLNRAESMFRRGAYIVDPQFPQGLGYEAAGAVVYSTLCPGPAMGPGRGRRYSRL
jgi:NADPH:quinone reductase-like Zn-dependent oxidoreductase